MTIEDDIAFLEQVPILRRLGAPRVAHPRHRRRKLCGPSRPSPVRGRRAADCAYIVQQGSFRLEPERAARRRGRCRAGHFARRVGAACGNGAARHRHRARNLHGAAHLARHVPENAGKLSGCRAAAARTDRFARRSMGAANWKTSAPRWRAAPGRSRSPARSLSIIFGLSAVLDFQADKPRQQRRRIELSNHPFEIGETARQWMYRHDIAVAQCRQR